LIEHYEKFLSLWKDNDSGITEAEDAQKRLAGVEEPLNKMSLNLIISRHIDPSFF